MTGCAGFIALRSERKGDHSGRTRNSGAAAACGVEWFASGTAPGGLANIQFVPKRQRAPLSKPRLSSRSAPKKISPLQTNVGVPNTPFA
jgi:hypothetical protein